MGFLEDFVEACNEIYAYNKPAAFFLLFIMTIGFFSLCGFICYCIYDCVLEYREWKENRIVEEFTQRTE
jgi:hypothetical protein